MNQLFEQVSALFARLNRREQRLVALLGICLTLATLVVLVVYPLIDSHARMDRGLRKLKSDIRAMQQAGSDIQGLQVKLGHSAGRVHADADFSLFSFVDRITASAVDKDSIESMNPSRRQLKPGVEEMVVELRLSRVPLGAVVTVLKSVEESGKPVYIKQLQLKRRYDDKTRFDVMMIAATTVGA